MPEMTVHDRMMSVYRHQKPDKTPVVMYLRQLQRGACEREARNLGLGLIEQVMPILTAFAPPYHTYDQYLSEVKGADLEVRFSYEDGERIETRIFHTPVGTVSQQIRKDPSYNSNWIKKFYIESREDYRVVKYLWENTTIVPNHGAVRSKIADLGGDGVMYGRMERSPYQKLLIELAGPERFLCDLHSDPEPVLELMETMERCMDKALEMALDSPVEIIWLPDNVTGDMTPPKAFKKYILPFYEKVAKVCRQTGKPFLVHMDGRTKALKDLIAQAPIDGIESFSFPIIGGDLPFADALATWKGKVVLPNFPATLCHESSEAVVKFLDEMMAQVPADQPFMLQLSEPIPPGEWRRVVPLLAHYFASLSS